MSINGGLLLAGTGMITPLGAGVIMTNSSLDAGINRYKEVGLIDGMVLDNAEDDESFTRMALVPNTALRHAIDTKLLSDTLSRKQLRMLRLANQAMTELVPTLPPEPVPLFLAGPEPYLQCPGVDLGFIENLARQSGAKIDLDYSRCVNVGRAGAVDVIETAAKYMASCNKGYALVGGVDSFFDLKIMRYLAKTGRLLTCGASQGFVPGEGAAFLLLVSTAAAAEDGITPLASLSSPGMALEEGHILGEGIYRCDGLAAAFANALAKGSPPISRIYSSENGEMHYAKELSVAITRNRKALIPACNVQRPSAFFGDLGAAFATVAVGLASANLSAHPHSLVYGSSDSGLRAAVCVSVPGVK